MSAMDNLIVNLVLKCDSPSSTDPETVTCLAPTEQAEGDRVVEMD